MDETREAAIRFLNSMRGQYIMGQALCVAIDTMMEVQPPHREESNISDMRYLRDSLFPLFAEIEKIKAPDGWRADVKEGT